MVRFKNRHILVEFLSPAALRSTISDTSVLPPQGLNPPDINGNGNDNDDEDTLPLLPVMPFLIPSPDPQNRLNLGDESGKAIYAAVKQMIVDVFGDEGLGRIASSFKVIYHSPLTTLTIIRVARAHYRTLWAGITLLSEINNQPVLPRVIALSGTIKKLQNRAIGYHRVVTAQMLAVHLASGQMQTQGHGVGGGVGRMELMQREKEEKKMREEWEREEEMINAIQD